MGCHGKVEVSEEHDTLAFMVSLILVKSCEISGLLLKAKKFKRQTFCTIWNGDE